MVQSLRQHDKTEVQDSNKQNLVFKVYAEEVLSQEFAWSPPNVHRWSMLRRGTRRGWWRLWRTWTIFGCLSILLKAGMFIIDTMCIHRAYIYFPSIGVFKISLPAMKGRSSPEPLPLKRPARRCVSKERSGNAMPCNHSTSWIPRTTWNTHFLIYTKHWK